MDLWWHIGGYQRVRLTGADLARTLRELAQLRLRMEDVEFITGLTVDFSIARRQRGILDEYVRRHNLKLESAQARGGPELVKNALSKPLLILMAAVLLGASLYLPTRILFIRVEGNESVPTRRILEMAQDCGVSFWASRGALRSEQVKNQLLSAIPELSWVGVNTQGSVATISVRERQLEQTTAEPVPGNIVAIRDAIVDEITVTAGTNACTVGQAVQAGQILVSGYTDLGICTRVEAAQGEVYGLTERPIEAIIPEKTGVRGAEDGVERKISVIFGKKRINFGSDSGILQAGCGKMTQVKQLVLPGGWELPVYLVIETYTHYPVHKTARPDWQAEALLLESARRHTEEAMTAGTILDQETKLERSDGRYRLICQFQCRELIGKQNNGVLLEGDTKDDGTNRERGAG